MVHAEYNIDTQITILLFLLKFFATFNMRLWYEKENLEENVVNNISIRCINCGKTTGLYVKQCISLSKDKASNPQWGNQRGAPQRNLWESINPGR